MSRDEILKKFQTLMQQIMSLESIDSVRPDASLRDDLNVDSLGIIDIIVAIEDGFGVKIRSDVNLLESLHTVNDAVDLIENLMATEPQLQGVE